MLYWIIIQLNINHLFVYNEVVLSIAHVVLFTSY